MTKHFFITNSEFGGEDRRQHAIDVVRDHIVQSMDSIDLYNLIVEGRIFTCFHDNCFLNGILSHRRTDSQAGERRICLFDGRSWGA